MPIISILVFYNDQWAGHQSYPRTSMADCNLIKKDEVNKWMKLFLEITPRNTAIFVMNKCTYPPICKIACDVLIVFDEKFNMDILFN